MSTRPRRQRPSLPPWLAAPRRLELARKDGKPVRVTFQLTEAQRRGLDRILKTAEREHVQLSEGDVLRVALDELLAAFERAGQDQPGQAGGTAEEVKDQ
jgi:hypothetical protein